MVSKHPCSKIGLDGFYHGESDSRNPQESLMMIFRKLTNVWVLNADLNGVTVYMTYMLSL